MAKKIMDKAEVTCSAWEYKLTLYFNFKKYVTLGITPLDVKFNWE